MAQDSRAKLPKTEAVTEWHINTKLAQFTLAKPLQPGYNLKIRYLPILKKS